MKVSIVVGAKSLELANPIKESLKGYHVNVLDGSKSKSFSQLLNEVICVTRHSDIVVFCSHKVRPVISDIQFIVNKINEGYGLVFLYKMACFGFRPEVFRRIGLFDERFEPAGYEDDDIYIRLVEADIGIYEKQCVKYIPSSSTWSQELIEIEGIEFKQPITYLFFIKKWQKNKDNTFIRKLEEQPPCYIIGESDPSIKFKKFNESIIESKGIVFPKAVYKDLEIKNKKWLIIGGTGSLGQKLIETYSNNNQLYVMSRDENKHWQLKEKYKSTNFILGDIRNYQKVLDTILQVNPHIIIMAAALKHIDTCEYEINESLETNTLGTMNVLKVIRTNYNNLKRLETILFISTDKACYPINTYGMCKSLSEKAIIEDSLKMKLQKFKYLNIRYGNVLNSRGSIIPKLKESKDSTYYLTHEDMTRFIMTQEDSVNLINYAILNGESGDTIIPKINAMKIKDLFELFSERYSKNIEISKLRPGEKMHESLLNINELKRTIEKNNYYIIKPDYNTDNYKFIKDISSYDSCDRLITKTELKEYLKEQNLLDSV